MSFHLHIVDSEFELVKKFKSLLIDWFNIECKAKENFNICVSGGSIINYFSLLFPLPEQLERQLVIYFCDERLLSYNDAESNYGEYKRKLIDQNILPENKWKYVDTSLDAAENYEKLMKQQFDDVALPVFDVIILGIGPDGHTCSLFSNDQKLLSERKRWVAPVEHSPKPPSQRVTLTLPVLNNAKHILFIATGKSKASIIKSILIDKLPLPANLVQPMNGTVTWLLDHDSSNLL